MNKNRKIAHAVQQLQQLQLYRNTQFFVENTGSKSAVKN